MAIFNGYVKLPEGMSDDPVKLKAFRNLGLLAAVPT